MTPAEDRRLQNGEILLSRRVRDALSPAGNDSLALRFEKPSAVPMEMPLGDRRGDHALRRPVRSRGLLPDTALGRFSLVANQVPPLNVFASRAWLADEAGVTQGCNLLLSGAAPAKLEAALRAVLRPADLGVSVDAATGGVRLVQSDRIYLDEAYTRALSANTPAPVLALHHLVDAFVAAGTGGASSASPAWRRGAPPSSSASNGVDGVALESPYGFITAETPGADGRLGVVPADMQDNEVVINAWLAEKLKLAAGDALTLRWRRFESGGRLVPDAATFRVARVIDMAACAPERALLPRFPGLSDVDRCADWDVGMAMDKEKLNDPDNEAYWKAYGPTPKAFVTLAAGRLMLGTHFGSAMTARFAPETAQNVIMAALRQADPQALGLLARPLRQEALQAAGQAMDFRQLFVGMAFVLMVSALLLTGLLASLGVAHRREEVGVLRAAGFLPRQVAALWLAESLPPLVAGVVAGVAAGLGGAWLLVWALNRFWSRAVASAQIPFTAGVEACAAAGAVSLLLSLLAVHGGVRRALRVQVRDLLGDRTEEAPGGVGRRWLVGNFAVGMGAAVAAIVLLALFGRASGAAASGTFFGAGLLLMISLLCFARLLAHFVGGAAGCPATGPVRAGLRNVARHRGRSLLVMVLLATGCFLTVGTLSMKQDPAANLRQSGSGSGGFDAMVELSIPLPGDQADEAIRQALDAGATVLPFRAREGDEAGCLNLNRAVQPRLLGVSPEAAAAVRAFDRPGSGASVWSLLQQPMPDNTIPVLAGDLTTVEYGLQATVGLREGSVYEYAGEDGVVWRLRVVGALPVRTGVLQGSLLVDESVFTRLAPSSPGHGIWLVRSSLPEAAVSGRLRRALGRSGAIVTPTRERLRLLGAVESTYLDMFLILGGLGVVLGAAGVGLVVLRHAAARRGELALLRAVGLPPRTVLGYLMAEHVYVLLAGLAAGVVPALVAVQPAMRSLGQEMPVGAMAAMIFAMVAAGLLGTLAAVRAASRRQLLDALRGD
ncbi:MAG: ABC transporter permease [bacterium]